MKILTKNLSTLKSRDKVLLECKNCKSEFNRSKNDVQRAIKGTRCQINFCKPECSWKYKQISKMICCKTCSTDFIGLPERKFCSRKCAATTNNKGRIKKLVRTCGYCKLEVNKPVKYCNNECSQGFRKQKVLNAWINGTYISKLKLSRVIREYLIVQANHKCSLCGWGEVNPKHQKVMLEIDHIDGNWRNNHPSNLRVLCPNCHSLTPTFKNLNSGLGREFRRKKIW